MCGVAGIFHYGEPRRPVDRAALARMVALLAHRGPDGAGLYVDGPLGLGHRRLSVLAPGRAGAQPMLAADGEQALAFNGEIYGHLGLRARLGARAPRWRGGGDTETLLAWLVAFGPDGLAELAGIFALAAWDRRRRRLLLARDPLGVKQLYLHDDGRRLAFASEIKALLVCPGVARDLDPAALNEYVHFHQPLGARTFFAGVAQVRPGHYVVVDGAGARARRYWALGLAPEARPARAHVAVLRATLEEVVDSQLAADVPVGAFFSGGLDSSAIAAVAAVRGHRLPLFGVHFGHPEVVDERPYQEEVAAHLGLPLHMTTLGPEALPEQLPELLAAQDQPMIGAAMLAMAAVSRLAAGHVRVCLGGQGADEALGGYARYALAAPWLALGGSGSGGGGGGSLWRQLAAPQVAARLARGSLVRGRERRVFAALVRHGPGLWRRTLGAGAWYQRGAAEAHFLAALARSPGTHLGDRLLHWDLESYLPGLLHQDDRMSMVAGIESRVPFADPRLVRAAMAIPFALKLRQGCGKWALRQAVADLLPPRVLTRRKVGFDAPLAAWLRAARRGFVADVLDTPQARARGLFDPARVAAFVASPGHPAWASVTWKLLCVELWLRTAVDRAPAAPAAAASPPALHVAEARCA